MNQKSPASDGTDVLRERLRQESDAGRRLNLIDLALRPREPQLLDTCIVQNLDWVDRQIEANNGPHFHADLQGMLNGMTQKKLNLARSSERN